MRADDEAAASSSAYIHQRVRAYLRPYQTFYSLGLPLVFVLFIASFTGVWIMWPNHHERHVVTEDDDEGCSECGTRFVTILFVSILATGIPTAIANDTFWRMLTRNFRFHFLKEPTRAAAIQALRDLTAPPQQQKLSALAGYLLQQLNIPPPETPAQPADAALEQQLSSLGETSAPQAPEEPASKPPPPLPFVPLEPDKRSNGS